MGNLETYSPQNKFREKIISKKNGLYCITVCGGYSSGNEQSSTKWSSSKESLSLSM